MKAFPWILLFLPATVLLAQNEIKWPPPKDLPLHLEVKGRIEDPTLKESSGFDQSRKVTGRFWSHNDSTGGALLYVMDATGKPLSDPIPVEGATNTDWEDLAIDAQGRMWIAEVGNNATYRQDTKHYQLKKTGEPHPSYLTVDRERGIQYTGR